ncbi:unnamed protein product, partial [Discosporangium mesarthrocarpum]
QYRVTGRSGATVRAGEPLDSQIQCTLTPGTIVEVAQVKGRQEHRFTAEHHSVPAQRCRIVQPVTGWGSIATENGYVIIEPVTARPRYRVIYPEGVIVRTSADIDDSDFVRVIPRNEVVEATGRTEMFDNVERVQARAG